MVQTGPLQSPFRNTLAFIRFEDQYDQSVAPMVLQGYSDYFHTMHLSQGNWESGASDAVNITHDFYDEDASSYDAVSKIAQMLLDDSDSPINGIFFFKDTSWIRPLSFQQDIDHMWLLDSQDSKCFSGISGMGEMGDDDEDGSAARLAVEAANVAREMDAKYVINPNGWCNG